MATSTKSRSDETISNRSAKAHEAVDKAANAAHETVDKAAEKAEQYERRAREAGHHARERTDETLASVQSFVQERPLAALGIAFLVGVAASSLLRR